MNRTKVITANLLAEKPYQKYSKAARLDFGQRSEKFYRQISTLMPDVLLLQEVDTWWREYLELNLSRLGYSMHFGACWSSGLAVLWRETMKKAGSIPPLNFSDAGVLAMELEFVATSERIHFINLHAPWGKAENFDQDYLSALEGKSPVLIAGDFNTDDPERNNNAHYFFQQLFRSDKGFKELSEGLSFTARNVKSNNAEKLDYMIGLNLSGSDTQIYPKELSLLIPHSPGGTYDPKNEENHFSDHALVMATLIV
jgi:endonuclease/exonuclease/phosphatase family metal-dependent hydrolase